MAKRKKASNVEGMAKALGVTEVAVVLGTTYQTAYHMIMAGTLPHFYVGNRLKVLDRDLEAYIERIMIHG